MKITDFLQPENCVASLASSGKEEALRELTEQVRIEGEPSDVETIFKALMEREKLGSTGIGDEVAIPHAKIKGLPPLVGAFGRSEKGIEYYSVDDKPVKWIFLLLASDNSTGYHLKALARISRLMKSKGFREKMSKAYTSEDIYALIMEEDDKLG
ncbi:MAG: PTS sugar transporter subunit IIA [Nitrospinota bacterium]|nr:PTS sugar transporter subunit IIA [Nitrospinota bacterium]MDH5677039.1 PTS sugar transporter subunit IIA [Nitrospinota bacterium]MDH5755066.1 PTS sugar transporter subunit IIA [Nitrospinota bacterium]